MIDVERLRRQSRWFSRLTLLLLTATALLVVVPTAISIANSESRGEPVSIVLASAILVWGPALFYLYGLAAVRSAFAEFAAGGVFGPALASACTRAGAAIAAGATMSAVGVPNLRRALIAAGIIPGEGRTIGPVLHFDAAYLAVGLVGLALVLLGRLLARAFEIQSEAARLRGELDEIF